MALPVNEKELIEGIFVEWERLEYKKGWQPVEILHTICAFANDINNWGGGYIIIGIEEDNEQPILPPAGLKKNQLDTIQKKVIELSYKIQPNYTPIIQPYKYNGKYVLIIWVPGGDIRPYKVPDSLGKKKPNLSYYIRKASITVQAKGVDERRLLGLAQKIPFDDRINHNAEISDLDVQVIKDFLKSVNSSLYKEVDNISFDELCEQMNIFRGSKEYKKPVNVGLLFFSKAPEKSFRGAAIEVIIYHDDIGDSLSEKVFKGPLHIQLKVALEYIQNNVIREEVRKVKGKAQAERFFNYPYEAIEEALANAVYHRSYELQNTIEVNVRLDCIEILSFPGPVPPIDNNTLKKSRIVARDYRNRRIGDFLKELKLSEGRATGIPKMRKAMKLNGSPVPIFETDEDRTYFLTVLSIHSGIKPESGQQGDLASTTQVKKKQELQPESPTQSPTQSTDPVIRLLNILQHEEFSAGKLRAELKIKHRPTFRANYLHPALKLHLIEYTIPAKPNSRLQKYRLTKKGKECIEKY